MNCSIIEHSSKFGRAQCLSSQIINDRKLKAEVGMAGTGIVTAMRSDSLMAKEGKPSEPPDSALAMPLSLGQ